MPPSPLTCQTSFRIGLGETATCSVTVADRPLNTMGNNRTEQDKDKASDFVYWANADGHYNTDRLPHP